MAHQAALSGYLDEVRPQLPEMDPDLHYAIRLDVGLPESSALVAVRDLDNWLYPLARRLDSGHIASAWATKRFAGRSRIWLEPVCRIPTPPGRGYRLSLNSSYLTPAFRETIASQLVKQGAAVVAPGEPLAVQISFVVGPRRNWLNLWRPTIDALGALLGEGPKPWAPQDGRITSLGLHREVTMALWNEVLIQVHVTPAEAAVPSQPVSSARLVSDGPHRLPVQR